MFDKLSNVSAGVSNWFGEVRERSDFIEWLKIAPYKKIMDYRVSKRSRVSTTIRDSR